MEKDLNDKLKHKKSMEAEEKILEEKLKERREEIARRNEANEKRAKTQPEED